MKQYLFRFSIGPVQSFITQARRTQDLYAGSQLLSDLIDDVLKQARKIPEIQFKLQFPAPDAPAKPNRFFAILQADSDETVRTFGKGLQAHVKETFREIGCARFREVLKKNGQEAPQIPEDFITQLQQHVEVYWAAKEIGNEVYNGEEYRELETLFGAVKTTRPFDQLPERGRKCSMCGLRNVLFYRSDANAKDKMCIKPAHKKHEHLVKAYHDALLEIPQGPRSQFMPDNEGLCAVCFTKRYYQTQPFPSTTEIALYNQLSHEALRSFRNGNQIYQREQLDPQLLYEENLTQRFREKYHIKHDLKKVKDVRKEFLKNHNLTGEKLSKYYALLKFDVDHMGAWFSGTYVQDGQLQEFHQKLSICFGNFARSAENYLNESKGKTVFAGGDDFLGFVNPASLLKVLKHLRYLFHETVSEPIAQQFNLNEMLTFSAGVTIAHYKLPLSEVLKQTRSMLAEAKKEEKQSGGGRDAVGLAAMTHSGNMTTTVLKWTPTFFKKEQKQEEKRELLSSVIEQLQKESVSPKFISNLDVEFRKLLTNKGELNIPSVTEAVVHAEIARLLRRATARRLDKDTRKELINTLSNDLNILYHASGTFGNFLSALHVAAFLAREVK